MHKVLALLVVVIAGVGLGLALLPSWDAEASGHSAERSFSALSVAPGETVTVTIVASGYGGLGRIVETVPDAFTTSDGSQMVTFRLLAAGPQTSTYTVTATDLTGTYTFSGYLADEGKDNRAVGGEFTVTITAPSAATATATAIPTQGTGASATRSFSATSVAPGETVTVTIVARDYGGLGRIVETVPDGFTTSDGSQMVTFRLLAAGPQTSTYTVTATDMTGTYTFSGNLEAEDKSSRAVGDASRVAITALPDSSAVRSFSASSVRPGARFTVTVRADNFGKVGRITETLPAGFTSTDAEGRTVTFRLLQEGPQTRNYTVTAPARTGTYTFSGNLEAEDKSSRAVGGTSSVSVRRASTSGGGTGGGGGSGGGGDTGGGGTPATTTPAGSPPIIAGGTREEFSVPENMTAVTSLSVVDGRTVTWSISGGFDAAEFTIGADSGELTFKTAPDFETPTDEGANNVYVVVVGATDSDTLSDTLVVLVTVTDVEDESTATPEPTVAPTAMPAPTATPTAVPTATSMPEPTATSMPVATAVSMPVATATSMPVAIATSMPVAIATSMPVAIATSMPVAIATSMPEPTATSMPEPTATSMPAPTAVAPEEPGGGFPILWVVGLIALVVVVAGAAFYIRSRR